LTLLDKLLSLPVMSLRVSTVYLAVTASYADSLNKASSF